MMVTYQHADTQAVFFSIYTYKLLTKYAVLWVIFWDPLVLHLISTLDWTLTLFYMYVYALCEHLRETSIYAALFIYGFKLIILT